MRWGAAVALLSLVMIMSPAQAEFHAALSAWAGAGAGWGHREEVEEAGRGRCSADGDHHGSERQAAKSGCGSALDPPRLHIEDPCECDHDWKASGERDDDIRKHRIGPMQPVRDGLDDLQNCERRNSVPDQGAEYAPALQFPK